MDHNNKEIMRLLKKKHCHALLTMLAEGDKSFNELSAASNTTGVHDIMKIAEHIGVVESYNDHKTGYKMFHLKIRNININIQPSKIKITVA